MRPARTAALYYVSRGDGSSQFSRTLGKTGQTLGPRNIPHVNDQRVEIGPPLCRIDAGDRLCIACLGGQAIDRLGRHRDRLTRRDKRGRLRDSCAIEMLYNCRLGGVGHAAL